jgi:uncharacterized protein
MSICPFLGQNRLLMTPAWRSFLPRPRSIARCGLANVTGPARADLPEGRLGMPAGRQEQPGALPGNARGGGLKSDGVTFEWDALKAAANFKKHGVTFEDGSSVFFDPLAITYSDPDHSMDERREVTLGYTMKKELVFVSHCERGERIRIIGARLATRTERRQYEEGIGS